jgi:hypothetical protein
MNRVDVKQRTRNGMTNVALSTHDLGRGRGLDLDDRRERNDAHRPARWNLQC